MLAADTCISVGMNVFVIIVSTAHVVFKLSDSILSGYGMGISVCEGLSGMHGEGIVRVGNARFLLAGAGVVDPGIDTSCGGGTSWRYEKGNARAGFRGCRGTCGARMDVPYAPAGRD